MGPEGLSPYPLAITIKHRQGATGFTSPPWAGRCVLFSPFEEWQAVHFAYDEIEQNKADMTADVDHDGVSNLLEYALGGNPKVADAAALALTPTTTGNQFRIAFKCNAACTDLTSTVQSSTNLAGPWTDIAHSVNGSIMVPIGALSTVSDAGFGLRTVTVGDATPVSTSTKRFLRIKVAIP